MKCRVALRVRIGKSIRACNASPHGFQPPAQSVALNDLDGDGLPNDVCNVDPRTDSVTVAPAPGTDMRYEPFELNAGALYNAATMAPMGCLPGDLNEDGLMDIVVYYWGRTPIVFLARKQREPAQTAPLKREL